MRHARKFALVAVAVALALVALPPVLLADAPAPAALAAFVPAARQSLWAEEIDGMCLPPHLRFVEARCRADGGEAVALVFEEWRPPYLGVTYAYALRRSMPTDPRESWAGGIGVKALDADDEFVSQVGPDAVPCS